ncbi:NAD(P)-dependent oxidoreductase [Candidatus Pelagibacter sp.]|nr:NAD(P)-dependent oxidoreductase [Candidatus Pelagibacter sp.]
MRNILITGGAGFIGLNIAKSLNFNKNKIFLIDKNLPNDQLFKQFCKNKNVKLIKKDLSSNLKLFENIKFDLVFHLAASVGVKIIKDAPFSSFNNNILSTLNLVNALKKTNFKGRLIFFSTSEVYQGQKINLETHNFIINNKTSNRDSYYLSKLFCEKLIILSKIDYLILRPHNIYGPRMGNKHVIPNLCKKVKKKGKYLEVYSPKHKRCFCFINDAIDQIKFLSLKKRLKTRIYNIGNSSEEINMFNLANKILKIYASKKKIKRLKSEEGSPHIRIPSIKNLKNNGWNKKFVSLKEGLKLTISYYENN